MSGLMLTLLGVLRLGSLIRHIPHAVTVGFTCGIAVTIAASQLKDLGGLHLHGAEPGPLVPKLVALAGASSTLAPAALAIGLGTAAIIFGVRRYRPTWPGMLIAVVAAAVVAALAHLPVETIGARFGALPHGLPMPRLPRRERASLAAASAGRAVVHPAGRHREPAVCKSRGRHDGTQASVQHGADRPGSGQCGLRCLRRHQCDRAPSRGRRPMCAPAG